MEVPLPRSLLSGSLYVAALMQSAAAAAQEVPAPDLSPTAAALTMVASESIPPDAAASSASRPRSAASEAPAPRPGSDLPGLERKSDGSYRFHGTNFTATIAPDGQVQFRDHFLGMRRMSPLREGPDALPSTALVPVTSPWLALPFKMDLYAWIERKLGNDPYLSERRWFLEQTRTLREGLASDAAESALLTALVRIWSAASLSPTERKRETFALWDHSPDDARGEEIRANVAAFIRARCPRGSACAFTDAEIEQLNRERKGKTVFAPYAGKPQGREETAQDARSERPSSPDPRAEE